MPQPTESAEAKALTDALETVAHWVSNNEIELLRALRHDGESELNQELREHMDAWRAASNKFLESIR